MTTNRAADPVLTTGANDSSSAPVPDRQRSAIHRVPKTWLNVRSILFDAVTRLVAADACPILAWACKRPGGIRAEGM